MSSLAETEFTMKMKLRPGSSGRLVAYRTLGPSDREDLLDLDVDDDFRRVCFGFFVSVLRRRKIGV